MTWTRRPPAGRTAPHRRHAVPALLALTLAAISAFSPAPEPPHRAPLDGPIRVLRGFAPPAFPWLPGHRGVDLAAAARAQVRAPAAGRIGYTGDVAGRGVVTVHHQGGFRTTYLPVRPLLKGGTPVRPGDVIGLLEPQPEHCPVTCLHWGLLHGDRYLDPFLLLGRAQVRLLPFWRIPFGSPALPPPQPSSSPWGMSGLTRIPGLLDAPSAESRRAPGR